LNELVSAFRDFAPGVSQQVADVVDEIVKTALKTKIKAPDLKGYTVTVA